MLKFLTIILSAFLFVSCGARSDDTTPEMAQSLLKFRGYNFTEEDFFKALKQADPPSVKLFFQGGMKANLRNKEGETALTYAAAYGDVPTVKMLVENGADINERDANGNQPLFVAIKKNRDAIFEYLLDKDADPNSTGNTVNAKNQSVLYVAVLRRKRDFIQKLLDKGVDPNLGDDVGSLPLSEVILGFPPDMETFKAILAKMKDVNHQEKNGATLLIYAAKNADLPDDAQREMIRLLLEKGADKSLKDKEGKTALKWAQERKLKAAIDALK